MEKYNEILKRMEDTYKAETGFVPDKYSDTGIRMRILAGELFNISTELEWFKKQMFPTTATGIYLDYHSSERGIIRRNEVKAQGEVTFSLEYVITEEVVIPKGTVVTTSDEVPLRFITQREGVISPGKICVNVPAIAEKGGSEYNIAPVKINSSLTIIPGIYQIVNQNAFTGGLDTEDDDELRERLLYTYRNNNNGTNVAFYKKLAESVEGVYSAGVIPKNRGTGTVDVFIAREGEVADSKLISEVNRIIQKAREINVDVSVASAAKVMVNVGLKIAVETGYDFDEVKERCTEAIKKFIISLGVGNSLYMSDVGEVVYHTEGVKCYAFDFDYCNDMIFSQSRFPALNNVVIGKM